MALPPFWKVRRELDRIATQTARSVGRYVHDPIRKPIYDWTARWRQQITRGSLPLTDRVAVFVVFQPKGLAASIHLTLQHLRQNGFSVLVVSNGPLRADDRATLAANAALVMERPNVGYDFGAYRDGIRHLWSLGHDLSRLVLMNDSTWFPLRRDDDSLARMEALGADLAGHIFKTENEEKRGNDHVEAHLLMISKDFLRSQEFKSFWTRYAMSDRRSTTVKFGEKAFSQLALGSGRTVRTLMGREWLLATLGRLEDSDLKVVLDWTIDGFGQGRIDAARFRRAAANGELWRDDYLNWVDVSLRNSRVFLLSASFVMPALVYGGMGFAKKAQDIRFHHARQELLDLEADSLIPPLDDAVRSEISRSIRAWTPPKDQERLPRERTSLPASIHG